jgi:hypothetical protein
MLIASIPFPPCRRLVVTICSGGQLGVKAPWQHARDARARGGAVRLAPT